MQRFASDKRPAIRDQVAKAFLNKGITLVSLARNEEAVDIFDEIVLRFANDQEPEIRGKVASALYCKGLTCHYSDKDVAIATYEKLISLFTNSLEPEIRGLVEKARKQLNSLHGNDGTKDKPEGGN